MNTQLLLFKSAQRRALNNYKQRALKELKEACQIYKQSSNNNDRNRAYNKPTTNNELLYKNVVIATNNYVQSLKKQAYKMNTQARLIWLSYSELTNIDQLLNENQYYTVVSWVNSRNLVGIYIYTRI